jgi:hypothetical protein
MNKQKIIGLFVFLVLVLPLVNAYSLSITPNESQVVQENETLTLLLEVNGIGNNTFVESSGFGTITQLTNTESEFIWTPSIGLAGETNTSYKLEFEVTNQTNTSSKNLTVVVYKLNVPFEVTINASLQTNNELNSFEIYTENSAVCKYDLEDKVHSQKQYTANAQTVNQKTHKGSIQFSSDGQKTIYLSCKDNNFNLVNKTITYNVLLKPKATITLNPPSPLREGIVEVRVQTTTPLIGPPELKYRYSSETSDTFVTLIGSGNVFTGYIVIPKSDIQRVGTFSFKGTGTNNVESTEIISGKIFLVDGKLPETVSSVQIENQASRIKLEWVYLNEDIDQISEYRIYRRIGSGGVELVDYYKTTSNNVFYDTDIEFGESYYYRISAVKNSGAEGPLSREVFILHDTPLTTTVQTQTLSRELISELELKEDTVNRLILDLESAQRRLERELSEKGDMIRTLNILAQVRTQTTKITSLKTELSNLRNRSLTRQEFNTETSRLIEQSRAAFLEAPIDIRIIDSVKYQELTDDDKTSDLFTKYIRNSLSSSEIRSLREETIRLQDNILVEVENVLVEIIYPEFKENIAVVKKTISATNPISNAIVVEEVGIASNLQNVNFSTRPVIQDNVASFNLNTLERFSFTYFVKTNVQFDEIRNTKTIVTLDKRQTSNDLITGRVVDVPKGESGLLIPTIVLIIIASLLTSYYVYINNSDISILNSINNKLDSLRARFRKKQLSIIPQKDDSHKIIKLDEEIKPKEVNTNLGHINFEENKAPDQLDLDDLKSVLDNYKEDLEKRKNLTPSKIKELTLTINEIKTLCDTIQTESIYNYILKAKAELEETLNEIKPKKETKKIVKEAKSKKSFKQINKNVAIGKEFVTSKGILIYNLQQLVLELKSMKDEEFEFHVNKEKNDFANWIEHVIENKNLANNVRKIKKRKELIKLLS